MASGSSANSSAASRASPIAVRAHCAVAPAKPHAGVTPMRSRNAERPNPSRSVTATMAAATSSADGRRSGAVPGTTPSTRCGPTRRMRRRRPGRLRAACRRHRNCTNSAALQEVPWQLCGAAVQHHFGADGGDTCVEQCAGHRLVERRRPGSARSPRSAVHPALRAGTAHRTGPPPGCRVDAPAPRGAWPRPRPATPPGHAGRPDR